MLNRFQYLVWKCLLVSQFMIVHKSSAVFSVIQLCPHISACYIHFQKIPSFHDVSSFKFILWCLLVLGIRPYCTVWHQFHPGKAPDGEGDMYNHWSYIYFLVSERVLMTSTKCKQKLLVGESYRTCVWLSPVCMLLLDMSLLHALGRRHILRILPFPFKLDKLQMMLIMTTCAQVPRKQILILILNVLIILLITFLADWISLVFKDNLYSTWGKKVFYSTCNILCYSACLYLRISSPASQWYSFQVRNRISDLQLQATSIFYII